MEGATVDERAQEQQQDAIAKSDSGSPKDASCVTASPPKSDKASDTVANQSNPGMLAIRIVYAYTQLIASYLSGYQCTYTCMHVYTHTHAHTHTHTRARTLVHTHTHCYCTCIDSRDTASKETKAKKRFVR